MDKLRQLDWSDLRVLLTIHECGGASNAGAALGLSHQTISRRLSRLEVVLGLRLVNRERHPWILTQKGKSVYEHAARMEAVTRDVARYVQTEHPDKVERVSIASNAWGFDLMILPTLKALQQTYPKLAFDLISGDDPLDVQSGKADIALRFTGAPPPDLLGRCVGQLPMGVFGTHDLITALDETRAQSVTLIRLNDRPQHGKAWPIDAETFRTIICVNDFSALVSAVRHGVGVAVMPDVVGASCTNLARSRTITIETSPSAWLLRNQDSRGSSVIRAVEHEILKYGKNLLAVDPYAAFV